MKMKKFQKLFAIACLAAMTAGLVSCSSAAGNTDSSTGSTSTADGVTVKHIGTGSSMPPFCSLNDNGELEGYDIAVLKELDNRLEQYEFDIQYMDFSALIVSLDAGQLDMVSHQLVQSEARKEKYLFPEQYYCLSPMCLAVRSDSDIQTLADMAGKKINQNPTSYEYTMCTAWNDAHPGEEMDIIAVTDLSTADGYKQVANGQVDASLTYASTFNEVNAELGLDLKLTDVVMVEDTYQMFGSDEQEFCDAVSDTLKEMLDDGTLGELSNEYFGEDIFALYADKITIVPES